MSTGRGEETTTIDRRGVRGRVAMSLTAYGGPLATVSSFKCMGQVLSDSGYNWKEVIWNLRRARKKWVWLS